MLLRRQSGVPVSGGTLVSLASRLLFPTRIWSRGPIHIWSGWGALAPSAPIRRSRIRRHVRFPRFRSRTIPPSVSHPHLVWGESSCSVGAITAFPNPAVLSTPHCRGRSVPPSVAIRRLRAGRYAFCRLLFAGSPLQGGCSLVSGSFLSWCRAGVPKCFWRLDDVSKSDWRVP